MEPSTHGDDYLIEEYVKERDLISSFEELVVFGKRWSALWVDDGQEPSREPTIEETELADGSVDSSAWECLKILRSKDLEGHPNHCGHTTPSCWGMHLMLPVVFLEASLISGRYGVSLDLALVQRHGGFGALYGYE